MQIIPFQAVLPDLNLIASNDSFFGTVKKDYVEFRESGFFQNTDEPGFFVHRINTAERTHTGLVCCVPVADYINGNIKKHEHTVDTMEQQQLQLTIHRRSVVKPVLLTYPSQTEITKTIQQFLKTKKKPLLNINFEGPLQTHQIWAVKGEKWIAKFQSLFEKLVPQTYIADGHHRTKVMSLLHDRGMSKKIDLQCDYFLASLFPVDELVVWEYNRVFEGLNELTPTRFIAELSRKLDIRPLTTAARPTKKHTMTMFINGEWYSLRWRKRVLKKYTNDLVLLDVKLLNEELLKPIFKVTDIRADNRIKYVSGTKGWEGVRELTLKSPDRIGFCLFPMQLRDLMTIADAGEVLPPKSTWFEPRMRNGIIVQELR